MSRSIGMVLLLLVVACRGGEKQEQDQERVAAPAAQPAIVLGRYRADTLAAGGRVVTLELRPDSSAVFTIEMTGQPAIARTGRFSATGPNLRAEFPALDTLAPMLFRWRLITTRLVPVDWDRAVYGPAGLTLHLR